MQTCRQALLGALGVAYVDEGVVLPSVASGAPWSSEGSWKIQALADLVRSGAEAHPGLVLEPFIGSKLEASGWEQ